MSNTKYVLMFVVLSAAVLTGLTATGMSLGQTAFAEDDEKTQKIDQENNCKVEISNDESDHNEQNDNDNEVTCQNYLQNAGDDADNSGNPFSGRD
jgi:archaellum component FlaG (FlaF/FlaG flagellin family)